MRYLLTTFFVSTLLVSLIGCGSDETESKNGTVILTFDDHFTNNWYNYYPQISNRGATATFFITNYDNESHPLNPRKPVYLSKLREIENAGFELGNHSFSHKRANEMIDSVGVEEWFQSEIINSTCPMIEDGLNVKAFAYPHSNSNSKESDNKLLEHFSIIRTYAGLDAPLTDGIYLGGDVIIGAPIDEVSLDLNKLKNVLVSVSENNQTIVLSAHNIAENDENYLYIKPDSLFEIIDTAISLGMNFSTFSSLGTQKEINLKCN